MTGKTALNIEIFKRKGVKGVNIFICTLAKKLNENEKQV